MQLIHKIEHHIDMLKEKAIQLEEQTAHIGSALLKRHLNLILKELNILSKMVHNEYLAQDNIINKIKLIEIELSWIENELK